MKLELVSDKIMKIRTEENKGNKEHSETYFDFLEDTSIEIPDIPEFFKCDKCGYTSCNNSSFKNHNRTKKNEKKMKPLPD